MLSAICIAVVPFAYSLTELSGNVIFIIFYSLKFFIFSPQS
ncbi:putative membrane protein [Parabacteroides distasonis str. 3776 Po2 i]|nr:putative membrane protein [Parabacteroides distasonis str. 3776 Po2 i]